MKGSKEPLCCMPFINVDLYRKKGYLCQITNRLQTDKVITKYTKQAVCNLSHWYMCMGLEEVGGGQRNLQQINTMQY